MKGQIQNVLTIAAAAAVGYAFGTVANPSAFAQAICKGCMVSGANEVMLKDRNGNDRVILVVHDSSVQFKTPDGRLLFDSATRNRFDSMPPLQPVLQVGPIEAKEDAATWDDIATVHRRIDSVSESVLEIAARLNELTK